MIQSPDKPDGIPVLVDDRKNLTNALFLVGQPLILNAVSIPALAYIVIKLGPLGYGEWSVGASLVALTSFLAILGLRPLFIRAVVQDPERAMEALAEQLALRTLLAVAAGGIALALGFSLGYPSIIRECLVIVSISLIIGTMAGAITDLLQGFERQKLYASINLISGLTLTVLSVLAAWSGFGPVGIAFAYLSGPALSLFLLISIVRRSYGPVRFRWSIARFRELLSVSGKVGLQCTVESLGMRMEQLLVPKLVGIEQFGYFTAGSIPAVRLAIVPDSIATAYYPVIARHHQESEQASSRQVCQLMSISLAALLPISVCLYILAPYVAGFLFKSKPDICNEIIRITILALPLQAVAMSMMYSMMAAGRFSEAARRSIYSTVLSIIATIALVYAWGLQGACWASVVRWGLYICSIGPLFISTFPKVLTKTPFIGLTVSTVCMALLVTFIGGFHLQTSLKLGLGIGLGSIAYTVLLCFFQIIPVSSMKFFLDWKASLG